MKKQIVTLVALVSMFGAIANNEVVKPQNNKQVTFLKKTAEGVYLAVALPASADDNGTFKVVNQNGETIYTSIYTNRQFKKTILIEADVNFDDTFSIVFDGAKNTYREKVDASLLVPTTKVVVSTIWDDETEY